MWSLINYHINACFFTSAWLSQQSYCHGAGIRRPSVHQLTKVSHKLLHGSRPNFVENYLSAISPDTFSFFKILDFQIFTVCFLFVVFFGSLMEAKISKCYFSHICDPISTKLYDKYDSHLGIRLLLFWAIGQVLKIFWHFEILTWASQWENLKCEISQKWLIV